MGTTTLSDEPWQVSLFVARTGMYTLSVILAACLKCLSCLYVGWTSIKIAC